MTGDEQGSASFSLTMPLLKVWEDAEGELWFEGVASSTSLDRQQERMTSNAISKMGEQRGIELLPSHSAGPLEGLGVIEETWVDDEQFRVAGRLDKTNPTAHRLFTRAASGEPYALSVGGKVKKAFWDYDEEAGRRVRYIDDVELDHVAVCRPEDAANPDTYLAVLAKAAEQIAPQPVGEIAGGEKSDDLLMRIGKAAVDAARHIWPFGRTDDKEHATGEARNPDEADEEQSELYEEMRNALAEVHKALAELAEMKKESRNADSAKLGRPQSLPGQETTGAEMRDPWRGIV
ncbi:MAG: hypothetical protein J7M38_14540 [Armatimonadetes bacterium]|nr:hypothetical protein [Armatimonadota bacterium]